MKLILKCCSIFKLVIWVYNYNCLVMIFSKLFLYFFSDLVADCTEKNSTLSADVLKLLQGPKLTMTKKKRKMTIGLLSINILLVSIWNRCFNSSQPLHFSNIFYLVICEHESKIIIQYSRVYSTFAYPTFRIIRYTIAKKHESPTSTASCER